jgi:60 kDa SS-A/Ro ribonucleoprotein
MLNSCNQEVYKISDIEHVKRFLTLGTENGTYYIGEKDLVQQCITCIDRVLDTKSRNDLIFLLKVTKCKKPDTLIYLLASIVTYKVQDKSFQEFRNKGYELLDFICTTPTMLFMFIHYCKSLNQKNNKSNGWNNLHKRAINNWYNSKDNQKLIYMITKYKNRHSYEHKDIFRLSHIQTTDPIKSMIYKYVIKGLQDLQEIQQDPIYDFIYNYEKLIHADNEEVVLSILDTNHNFAWEHIPTSFLNNKQVLLKLLPNMPNIALLRNLNRLTRANVLEDQDTKYSIIKKLSEMTHINPIQALITFKMYNSGAGDKGSTTWTPDQEIVKELDKLFTRMFNEIIPINKRVCIALDVSGSMLGPKTVNGADCLCAAEVGCAMTMILEKSLANVEIMGFSKGFVPLNISYRNSLEDNLKMIRDLPFDATDCSLPIRWALKNQKRFDAFIIITDNETNSNYLPPAEELRIYRKYHDNPDTKMIVLATAPNNFTIADPNDKNMLDISGFDASVLEIICDFINPNKENLI